jgi:hypothetical protein
VLPDCAPPGPARITNSSSPPVQAAADLRRRRGPREGGCAGLHALVKHGHGEKARLAAARTEPASGDDLAVDASRQRASAQPPGARAGRAAAGWGCAGRSRALSVRSREAPVRLPGNRGRLAASRRDGTGRWQHLIAGRAGALPGRAAPGSRSGSESARARRVTRSRLRAGAVLLVAAISALIVVPLAAELGEIGAALRQTSWPWVAAALTSAATYPMAAIQVMGATRARLPPWPHHPGASRVRGAEPGGAGRDRRRRAERPLPGTTPARRARTAARRDPAPPPGVAHDDSRSFLPGTPIRNQDLLEYGRWNKRNRPEPLTHMPVQAAAYGPIESAVSRYRARSTPP